MSQAIRFPIKMSPVNGAVLRGLLIPPGRAYVEVRDDALDVRMGWAFSARIPRRLVNGARPGKGPRVRFTAGAHGWAGRWLVNGAPDGIVDIELAEPVRASVSGFPVRLRVLSVSLEDPDAFLSSLAGR